MSTPDDPYATPPGGSPPSPDQPTYGQTKYGQPTYGQPTYGQPGPAQPGSPQPGYGAPAYGQPVYAAPGYPQAPTGTNGLAIASLIVAFAGLVSCGIGAVVAIVLGFVALSQIKRTGQAGRGLAIAGIAVATSILVIAIGTVVAVIVFGSTSSHACTFTDGSGTPGYTRCVTTN